MSMKPTYEQLEAQVLELSVKLANVESKCAELAAENASVKAMNDCLSEELRGYESDGAFDGPKMHLLWWQCKTPATDAAIANIQAQGVEMAIDHIVQTICPNHETILREFAAQLRQGAEHE